MSSLVKEDGFSLRTVCFDFVIKERVITDMFCFCDRWRNPEEVCGALPLE